MMKTTHQKVALVAGATRGAGRGIATELALAGYLVYCTGRSTRRVTRNSASSPFALEGRPESIEETVEIIARLGGEAVAVRTDHSKAHEVASLVEQIQRERGRLDVLVNDIWGGDALTEWGTPFWQLDLEKGRTLLSRAIETHIITSRLAVPLMRAGKAGLIVEITDGDALHYRGNLYYDLAKVSVIRLAFAMAEELRGTGLTALAVTPGFLRSEAMLEHFGVTEQNWREACAKDPHFAHSETPRYVGRAIAALAKDPQVHVKAGGLFSSWGLAKEYGFTDIDGAQPDFGAHARTQGFGADQAASHRRFVASTK